MASAAIEYAAQAMAACTAALLAPAAGARAVAGLPGERARRPARMPGGSTTCHASIATSCASSPSARRATPARLLYAFSCEHDGREVASGRLAVVLDAGLAQAR